MKILILGANGMFAKTLIDILTLNKFNVFGTSRQYSNKSNKNYYDNYELVSGVDFKCEDSILNTIRGIEPDIVINLVGITKYKESKVSAIDFIKINSIAPHLISSFCSKNKIRFIQLSTDCVFSGKKGNYKDFDNTDAIDIYGKTKALGEVSDDPYTLTIRTSFIGHNDTSNDGLLEWFLSNKNKSCKGFKTAIYSGMTTLELAKIFNDYIIPNKNLRGLYNISANPISKYNLLKIIGKIYKKNIKIIPSNDWVIDRSLDSHSFRSLTGYNPKTWEIMIDEMYRKKMFKDKTLLITGGTGSFGNAVLDKFLLTDIKEIRIFSRDELKQDNMRKKYNNPKLKFYLGDVRDINSLRDAVKGVDFLFHAAALKQVPSCEFYPMQAVHTNVIGTENVLNSAINAGVKKVIALSTDKAVYPINAMGISKAMMERVIVSKGRIETNTMIACTRYGNVMASRGSVIPLFINQIKKNIPITITDPGMTRFMMSLDQAVDLVIFAFKNGESGDIFVQKAPAATIELLANTLKEIFQKKDHEIKTIGTRHGEKLYETLLTKEEMVKAIDLGNYYRVPADNRDLNYNKYFDEGEEIISQADEYHSHNTHRLNKEELTNLLINLKEIESDLKEIIT